MRYPGTDSDAVRDVSFDVPPGAFAVVVGPSGCGKSTLLRTANRLVPISSGTVELDGTDVASLPAEALRRGIGYVIQAVGLFPHMTVARNVGLVPSLLHWPRERIDARVDELLARVALDPQRYRARYPRELSGGEQQRIGVARALAAYPRLLLMDEPFGALDPIVRRSLQNEMLELVRTQGTTVLFVTHDVDEALRLADVLVVMRDGRIEQSGTPLDVLARPKTAYVKALLGDGDSVRRLSLMHVGDALLSGNRPHASTIEARATLREALETLLRADGPLGVRDGTQTVGTLGFDEIRRALSQP